MNKNPNIKIITRFINAGDNIWEYINEKTDIDLYFYEDEFMEDNTPSIECKFDDEQWQGRKLFLYKLELEKEYYWHLTKEKEEKAYQRYTEEKQRYENNCYIADLSEKTTLNDFIVMIDNEFTDKYYWWIEENNYDKLKDYTVINYCNKIEKECPYAGVALYNISIDDDGNGIFENEFSGKNTTFLEVLFKTLTSCKVFTLLHCEGRIKTAQYTDYVELRILINHKENTIFILTADLAIKEFHKMIQAGVRFKDCEM